MITRVPQRFMKGEPRVYAISLPSGCRSYEGVPGRGKAVVHQAAACIPGVNGEQLLPETLLQRNPSMFVTSNGFQGKCRLVKPAESPSLGKALFRIA